MLFTCELNGQIKIGDYVTLKTLEIPSEGQLKMRMRLPKKVPVETVKPKQDHSVDLTTEFQGKKTNVTRWYNQGDCVFIGRSVTVNIKNVSQNSASLFIDAPKEFEVVVSSQAEVDQLHQESIAPDPNSNRSRGPRRHDPRSVQQVMREAVKHPSCE